MDYSSRVKKIKDSLDLPQKRQRLEELNKEMAKPDLWKDREKAEKITKESADLTKLIAEIDELEGDGENTEKLEQLEKRSLLNDKYDSYNAIVSVHAGAGGTDAQDWAQMLLRMYQRYVERGAEDDGIIDRSDWKLELVDSSRGEEAGIKSATFIVKGSYAYGLLKAEAGVHRLVRQSPFNAKALRQTSFAMVDVVPQIEQDSEVEINEKELRVDVFRSSGKGGQSVNTTDSAVRLTHIPTNIVVSIQNERTQQQNKEQAMKILKSRLLARQLEQSRAETDKVRGEVAKNEWGSQIRSYVLHPYKMVKDHRTKTEEKNVEAVLDGDINKFIYKYLETSKS